MLVKQPLTPAEWQEAVDLAEVWILVNDARLYGLIADGPPVNVRRCEEILAEGKARGFRPAADCVERLLGQPVPAVEIVSGHR